MNEQWELEQSRGSNSNCLSWILGGVGIAGLIGIVVYFATRKGENK